MSDTRPPGPVNPARVIDSMCDQFEDVWQAGRPPDLGAFVRAAPEPVRPELFRELLLLERDYRRKAGRPLDPAQAREQYADLGPWAGGILDDVLPGAPAVVLDVIAGPAAGKSYTLAGRSSFTIGRRPGLPFAQPEDPYLSRDHCVFEVDPPAVRVRDLGSKSGTFVNGRPVTEQALADGDEVRAGATVLRVRVLADGGGRPAARGEMDSTLPLGEPGP